MKRGRGLSRIEIVVTAVVWLLIMATASRAGNGTVTISDRARGSVHKITFTVISDTNENVHGQGDASTAALGTASIVRGAYSGTITRIVIDPNAVVPPDNGWDIYIFDEDSNDILNGAGVNIDTASTTEFNEISTNKVKHSIQSSIIRIDSDTTGNARGFRVDIFIEP